LSGACGILLAGAFAGTQQAAVLDPTDPNTTLAHIEIEVARRYRIDEITARDLRDFLNRTGTTLFDVRTAEEFDLGHLPNAIRVEPGLAVDEFLRRHGQQLEGKPAIFYCAVGIRSSELASRLAAEKPLMTAIGAFNLRGGAFRWVVDGRDLVKGDEAGRLHPYNSDWEELLTRALAVR
jgi:rhodanese-related sulfurtransferase